MFETDHPIRCKGAKKIFAASICEPTGASVISRAVTIRANKYIAADIASIVDALTDMTRYMNTVYQRKNPTMALSEKINQWITKLNTIRDEVEKNPDMISNPNFMDDIIDDIESFASIKDVEDMDSEIAYSPSKQYFIFSVGFYNEFVI